MIGPSLDPAVRLRARFRFLGDEHRAGGKRANLVESRGWLGDIAEAEIITAGLPIEGRAETGQGGDRLDLAREDELATRVRVEQRLHPEAIAREQEPAPARIVDREGEDAAQMLDQPLATLLVEMDEDLGVAAGTEQVAARREQRPQHAMVVDLAVEDDPDVARLIRERLGAGGRQIDQRQPAMDQLAPIVHPVTRAVRTAVGEQPVGALVPARRDR